MKGNRDGIRRVRSRRAGITPPDCGSFCRLHPPPRGLTASSGLHRFDRLAPV